MHPEGPRPLAAEARGREDLAGVADLVRVERAPEKLHGVEILRREHLRHVLLLVLADALQHSPELGARDDGVLDVVVVGDAAHRRERGLAALPEQRPLVVVLGDPDLGGVVLLADPYGLLELVLDLRGRAVELHYEDGAGLREAGMDGGLDRLDAQGVHHLYGGRHYAAADDPGYRAPGLLGVLEGREQGPDRLGLAHDA